MRDYTRDEQRLASFLRLLAGILIVISLALIILPYLLTNTSFFTAPPFFVTNTIAGLVLLAALAWLAAADVRRFRPMLYVLVGGLLVGAAAFLAMNLRPVNPMQDAPLLLGFGVCAALALAVTALIYRAKMPQAPWLPWLPDKPTGTWEQVCRLVFGLFGLGSLLAAAGSILLPYLGVTLLADLLVSPFMLAGSTIKIATLGLCALLVALDMRRYIHHTPMITLLILGHAASLVVISLLGLLGFDRFGSYTLAVGGSAISRDQMMFGAWALDVVLIAGFALLNNRVNRYLLDHLGFFSAAQFRGLEAIAETLIAGGEHELVPAHEIVLRTDNYLKSFRSERLALARLAVMGVQAAPLAWLNPPVNYLHPAAREDFINTRFKREVITPPFAYRLLEALVRAVNTLLLRLRRRPAAEVGAVLSFTGLLEAMMRFNMQLTYIGYYANPAVWPQRDDGRGIGYVPFSERPKDFAVTPLRPHPPLHVLTPDVLAQRGIDTIADADVVIIGSGAAGAILAEQLADQGRRVLVLEKGP